MTINFSEEDGLAQMHDIDEEALMAVAGLFRMVYDDNERTSFSHAMKLLSSHVDAAAPQLNSAAISALRGLRRAKGELLQQSGIQMVVARPRPDSTLEEETLTTKQIIELRLHGELLHAENEKSDALDAWPIRGLPLFEFCGAIRRLARLFWVGRNVVAEVLKHDELLDAVASSNDAPHVLG